MARTVQIELDVQDAKAVAAWQRSRDSIAQFHKQLDGVDQSNQKNKNSANAFFGEVRRGIGATAAAITGITGVVGGMLAVVQQLRAEYDNIVQRQRNAADATKTFEQNLAQAVRNATGIFSAQEVRGISLDVARSAGIDPARAASLVGSALTSTGVQNEADARLAIGAASAAARFAPDLDQGGLEATGGVAASIAKKFRVSPEAAIGFIQRVGTQANIRDLQPLVTNIAPTIPALSAIGFNEGESGSLLATLSQALDDAEGSLTRTAAINLGISLRERFADRFRKKDGSFDPIAAITALQQNPELRKRFFEGGEFSGRKFGQASLGRGIAQVPIEQLLTRGSAVARQFAGGAEAIGTFAQGEQTYVDLVRDIASVTPVSRAQRALEAGTARIGATSPEAISGVLRDNLSKLQQAAGTSSLQQRLTKLGLEFESRLGRDPEVALSYAATALESESANLRAGRLVTSAPIGDTYGFSSSTSYRVPATEREKDVATEIDVVVKELRNLIRAMENGGVKADVNLNINDAGQVRPGPTPRAALLGRGGR